MHAVYSITSSRGDQSKTRKRRRTINTAAEASDVKFFHFLLKQSRAEFNQEYTKTGQQSLHHDRHTHHLSRRSQGKPYGIGVNGKGTNMRMIRLIYYSDSSELSVDQNPTHVTKQYRQDQTQVELINPLVIGMSAVCVILVAALVVVGVMYRRKSNNSQRQKAIEISAIDAIARHGNGTPV